MFKYLFIVLILFSFSATQAHAEVQLQDPYKTYSSEQKINWLNKEWTEIATMTQKIKEIRKVYKKSMRNEYMNLVYQKNYRVSIYNSRAFEENKSLFNKLFLHYLPV